MHAPDARGEEHDARLKAHAVLQRTVAEWAAESARAVRDLQDEVVRRTRAEEALELRTAQLKAAALELAHAEQHERQRLSVVLHDHLQQLLVGAKLKIGLLGRPMTKTEFEEAIQDATGVLDEAIEQTRSLAVELSPPVLFEGGLVPALEWLGRWMQQKHGLTIRVTADESAVETGDEKTRLMLFTAVRELLFNVTKHANVTTASVQVQRVGDRIQIIVADSGIGFEALQAGASEEHAIGLGLFNIQKRLDFVGGRFEIDSIPGKGSRFTLDVPIGPCAPVAAPRIAFRTE
jgi:signal transduction histidine kinase